LTWLIACERSGIVRDAMIAAGYDAISCDIFPTRIPGPHLQGDVRKYLDRQWSGMIAHPDCTFLTNAGVRWLYKGGKRWIDQDGKRYENEIDPERWRLMEEACAFYLLLHEADHIPVRAIENPIMHEHAAEIIGHRADQFVHPWWFGSPFQKATGLKLINLPLLPKEREKSSYDPPPKQAVWLMAPSDDREELRSRTDVEVARAMAQYWGHLAGAGTPRQWEGVGGMHLSDPGSYKGAKGPNDV